MAFNLTLMSYCGSLDMGLNVDPAAVTEPELLRDLMVDAFAELAAAGSGTQGQEAEEGGVGRLSRPAASVADGRRAGEQRADVEQEVGHLVGGNQLAVEHLARGRGR